MLLGRLRSWHVSHGCLLIGMLYAHAATAQRVERMDVRAIAAHSDSVSADLLNAPPGMASLPTWSALLVRVVLRDPTPGGTRVRLESRWHNPLRTGAGRTQWTTQIARAPRAAGSSGLVVPVLVHGSQCTVTLRARIEGQPLARAVEHVVTLGTCGE